MTPLAAAMNAWRNRRSDRVNGVTGWVYANAYNIPDPDRRCRLDLGAPDDPSRCYQCDKPLPHKSSLN